jgi:hypothetical protein
VSLGRVGSDWVGTGAETMLSPQVVVIRRLIMAWSAAEHERQWDFRHPSGGHAYDSPGR